MEKLTFITGNAAKAEQLGRHLQHPVDHLKLDLLEVQSLSLEEVVEHKAKEAFKQTGLPVLVEDTSLVFTALGRLPGPLIKWFLTELGNDGLCKTLDSYENREALARVVFGYYDGKTIQMFDGEIKGTIASEPRGESGFGWDSVFVPEGWSKTWGEMTIEEQAQTSMRKMALKKLELFLNQLSDS